MLKTRKTVISMAAALCTLALAGGVTAVNANAENTATPVESTLAGFNSLGASVRLDELGMRFVFSLDGDALAKKDLTAGVVYMPYDLLGGADLKLGTDKALNVEFGWIDDVDATTESTTDMVGFTELPADVIPSTMYNRVLAVKGYIQDGDTTYYTDLTKASMANAAYKYSVANPNSEYAAQLNEYLGSHTLTPSVGEAISVVYGDNVLTKLPTEYDGKNIVAWYWDEAKTDQVTADDYATGSMKVYVEFEKFTVSGTVSGHNGETVSVQIDDKEYAVAEDGTYSIGLEAGEYNLRFYSENYVAYQDVTVSADLTQDVTMVDNTWEVGTFGSVVGDPQKFDTISMLSGSFTMAANNGGVVFPNTATTNAFEYTAVIKATAGRDQSAPMATISTIKAHISVGMYQYGHTVFLNISDGKNIGTAYNEAFNASALPEQNNTYTVKFVRLTSSEIKCYINNVLVFTFTKAELVLADGTTDKNWVPAANDVWTGWSRMGGFFEENANVCAGVMNGFGVNNYGIKTANYTLSMKEFAIVSGTITAGENVDVTNTTISAGGIACNATVNADGTYTALVPEGEQTLEFANGVWGATQTVNAVIGVTNTANVTLIDYTWKVGGFGSLAVSGMTYDEADALDDGKFAVTSSGVGGLLFPNLATTDNFTFEVAFTSISRTVVDGSYGICITDGEFVLSISLQRWEPVVFNLGTGFGAALIEYWNHETHSGYNGSETNKLKFVRTAEKIEFYYANVLYATFTTEATYSGMKNQMHNTSTEFRDYYAGYDQEFIGADKELTVGLVMLNGCTGFTADCTFTKN